MKLKKIANAIGGYCIGDDDIEIDSLAPVHSAGPTQLTFVAHSRLLDQLARSRAGAVILRQEDLDGWHGSAIVCADPYLGYARTAQLMDSTPVPDPGQHPTATVAMDAKVDRSAAVGPSCVVESRAIIGPGAMVGPGCVIGEEAVIGAAARLYANVTVYHRVLVGERCVVQSGAVLGSDGFGNAKQDGRWVRIPQLGTLKIGDDVQIGANSTIDRGALEDTIIGNGVVIDNQVQIAHNCEIGDHTGIAGCVGIAGSVKIGRCCTLAGGVGIADHVTITDDVHLTTMTLITSSILEPGIYSSGTGQMPNREWRRSVGRFRQLERMARRLKLLEGKLLK